jgi:hypothetical protein
MNCSRCLSHATGNGCISCGKPDRRPALEDPLDNVRREQCEADHAET